ncbi:MAG TPA: hypothetical protein PK829_13290 [Promineifilum sp.]|nr:hypothetical protein [Promineifilum sp.]HQF70425.1 hypothetical protein [Promineifilum sp.]
MRAYPLPSMLLLLAGLLLVACGGAPKQPPASFTPLLTATPLPTSDSQQPVEIPVPPDDPSTWNLYLNREYGFSFHYPSDRWTLATAEDGRQLLLTYGDTGIALRVKFARQDDAGADLQIFNGEVADLVPEGTMRFIGADVERSMLAYEGLVEWVFYNDAAPIPRGELLFSLALLSSNDYNAGVPAVVPDDVQAEADRILETFSLD